MWASDTTPPGKGGLPQRKGAGCQRQLLVRSPAASPRAPGAFPPLGLQGHLCLAGRFGSCVVCAPSERRARRATPPQPAAMGRVFNPPRVPVASHMCRSQGLALSGAPGRAPWVEKPGPAAHTPFQGQVWAVVCLPRPWDPGRGAGRWGPGRVCRCHGDHVLGSRWGGQHAIHIGVRLKGKVSTVVFGLNKKKKGRNLHQSLSIQARSKNSHLNLRKNLFRGRIYSGLSHFKVSRAYGSYEIRTLFIL